MNVIRLTPTEAITALKLARAAARLGGESSIKAIAFDEGFSTAAFDHHFRRHLQMSPSQFRPPPPVPLREP